jgi:LytS/YehU family sensor histidine kinase
MQAALRTAPGLDTTLVPRFCLQRLVENALKHNLDARAGAVLRIRVEAERTGDRLRMAVLDNGVGFRGSGVEEGVGLGNLREILALGYGAEGRLELGNGPDGGGRVVIELPMEASHG